MECIFCKIINNESPAAKVYEDDEVLAFMDVNPVNKGHILVIPKKHYQSLVETPDEILRELWVAAKKVGLALKKAVGADGLNFGVNNGAAAGQVVFHTHIHVIPRFNGDGLKLWPSKQYQEDEMEKLAEKIKMSF